MSSDALTDYPLVIYHGHCMDGACAAWVARHALLDKGAPGVQLHSATYGEAPPHVSGRDVVVVDFSYKRDALIDMARVAKSLRVLDHHKTAQEDLQGLPFCKFDMNRSGAGLAWDELVGGPRPWLVDYIEDRDLWRFKLPESEVVNSYIQTAGYDLDALAQVALDGLDNALAKGKVAMAVRRSYIDAVKDNTLLAKLAPDLPAVPGVNVPYWGVSEVVGELCEGHPFAFGWHISGTGRAVYSLRSRGDFDVSALAKRWGGGGHKNSAGFNVPAPVHFPVDTTTSRA
jgi:oligoribonuclease NrnB/cAMP/cGMP phosphodiesterase (DHH superfamily)